MNCRYALIIFAAALILRLLYVTAVYDGADSLRANDSHVYEMTADGLATTGKLVVRTSDGGYQPERERAPGYIFWLAGFQLAFGHHPLAPVLGQLVLDSMTCVLVAWMAGFLSGRLVLLAGLLAAANANMIVHSAQILSDSVFLFAFTAGTVATLGYIKGSGTGSAIAAGLLFGVAWLVRPIMLPFLILLPVTLAIAAWRLRTRPLLALVNAVGSTLILIMCVAPVYLQNQRDFGHLAFTTQTGTAALNWYVPLVREYADGVPPAETRALMNERLAVRMRSRGLETPPKNPFTHSAEMQVVARDALLESGIPALAQAWSIGAIINLMTPAVLSAPPVRAIERPGFFETPGANLFEKVGRFLSANAWFSALVISTAALTGLCRLLSLTGLTQIGGRINLGPTLFLVASGACILAVTGPITGVKYRLPLEPMLDSLMAAALVWLLGNAWRIRTVAGRPADRRPAETSQALDPERHI